LSFIPLIIRSKNLFSSESSLKYFLIQAIASAVFLFSIVLYFLFLNLKFNVQSYSFILISSTMLLKRGAAPFHFWFPSVIEGLSWSRGLILMTWQKIAPLMILSYSLRNNFIMFSIFCAIIFGSLGGLNQTSLRKFIAFSSINHLGWMLAGILRNENLWFTYFLFYVLLSISLIFMFNNFKLFNINQTFKIFNSNLFLKLSIFVVLLSLGGLPPFLGFMPKWLIIELLISNGLFFTLAFIVFLTLITLYFYLRLTYAALLLNHIEIKWNFKTAYHLSNRKLSLTICFISLFGLVIINWFYFFI